jgi:uncharacterized membrane protein YkvA (DUF1232 family)
VLRALAATLLVLAALWLLVVAALVVAGRRTEARALARFVPDCLVALTRLARDPRLARRDRIAILGVLAYLALPIDLIPDVIPVAGQLDDAIVVALLVRRLRRAGAGELLREHWQGPAETLEWLLGRGGDGDAPGRAGDRA